MREVQIGKKYKHFKNKLYEVILIALDSETLKKVVVYKSLYDDKIYTRDYDNFNSLVDKEKYPSVLQTYRFEEVND